MLEILCICVGLGYCVDCVVFVDFYWFIFRYVFEVI